MSLKAVIKFVNKTPKIEKDVSKFVDRAVGKSLVVMERNVKLAGRSLFYKRQHGEARKHERTGNLIRSVNRQKLGFGEGQIRINPIREGADVNYGVFVEYGTRFMTARPFIRTGVKNSERQIQEIFASEARKLTDI